MPLGWMISRRGARVRISGDSRTLAWIRARGQIYLEFAEDDETKATWHVVAGREHALEATFSRNGSCDTDPMSCDYRVNPDSRTIVVDVPRGPWRDLWTLRMVRHLLRWQLFHAGGIFLHGGVVAQGNSAAVLLGPSRGGKTTMLLQALRSNEVAFVAEDDATIVQEESGELTVLGWPGCVRLRRDMLHHFPEFSRVEQFSHPANRHNSDGENTGLLRIFSEELSASLNCAFVPEARLNVVARLEWAERPSSRPMKCDEVRVALLEAWDVLPERKPGTRHIVDSPFPRRENLASIRFCTTSSACRISRDSSKESTTLRT